MNTAKSDRRALFRKLDSTVLLERHDDSPTNAHVYVRPETARLSDIENGDAGASPVGLDLTIRFGRVFVCMVLTVAAVVSVTLWLQRGVELGKYNPAGMSTDDQQQLVDNYNSYTGNVASAFGMPIEMFIALAVQIVVLRLFTASMLSTKVGWKTEKFTLALTVGVGYLLANGLNSLNVQPQPPVITSVISAADLSYSPDVSTSDAALRTTNLSQTFSERSPKNPITNTVLRNLVLPCVPLAQSTCEPKNELDVTYSVSDVVLEYGLPQRDWQSRLLQEALEPKQLRVVVNPTNKTAKQPVNLPMNASLAADLFVHSLLVAPYYISWATLPRLVDEYNVTGKVEPLARLAGFLPPSTGDETSQRDWFLRESAKKMSQNLQSTVNLVRTDVVMEFSHVDISPSMRFDALTIDFEVDPMKIAEESTKDNSTHYNRVIPNLMCGSSPLRCLEPNPAPNLKTFSSDVPFDAPAQVQVFGTCVNDDGTEQLSLEKTASQSSGIYSFLHCASSSNTSLMVVSVAKRWVADSVTENKTANASGVFDDVGLGYVKNLRRIYSFTMAKLSWDQVDLTAEFNAICASGAGSCKGLRFPLDPVKANPELQQELIVGVDAIPTNLVAPLIIPDVATGARFVPLVQVHEPTSALVASNSALKGVPLALDPILPHNLGKVTWDLDASAQSGCTMAVDDRIQLVLNNHMYIEHGLQTAYTAAAFFVLQSGVVKDVIKLSDAQTTLNIEQNTETISLVASIPLQNALLTLGGCALLVLGIVFVMLLSCCSRTPGLGYGGIGHVSTPHVVARVMMDPARYPPLFLHRRLTGPTPGDDVGGSSKSKTSVKGFVIDGLGLQPPREA